MEYLSQFARLDGVVFDRIAFAHSLIADGYRYEVNTNGYGIYGKTPPDGGILEIGFVEQNPIACTVGGETVLFEENGIFVLPPQSVFSVSAKNPGQVHRHTSAEFLIRCKSQIVSAYAPANENTVTLPLYLAPSPENSEILDLIRSIACAKTLQTGRNFFEECADFMSLIAKLTERAGEGGDASDTVSPGNRRHCLRAKAYISRNIDRHLSVQDVADAVGVSKNYLTNVFSATEGIPLTEYINRSKLSYMTVLIRRYDLTLAQAGKHVGFTDVNYISRIFKRYYGMTVSEYKRSPQWRSGEE